MTVPQKVDLMGFELFLLVKVWIGVLWVTTICRLQFFCHDVQN